MLKTGGPTQKQQINPTLVSSSCLSCPQYAVESQIQLRGFDPQESMLLLKARPVQEQTVHTQFGCFAVS